MIVIHLTKLNDRENPAFPRKMAINIDIDARRLNPHPHSPKTNIFQGLNNYRRGINAKINVIDFANVFILVIQ